MIGSYDARYKPPVFSTYIKFTRQIYLIKCAVFFYAISIGYYLLSFLVRYVGYKLEKTMKLGTVLHLFCDEFRTKEI